MPHRSPDGQATPAPAETLFFVLLLSLLIALFDRFRGTRDPAADRQTVWPAFRAAIEQRRHRSTVAAKLNN